MPTKKVRKSPATKKLGAKKPSKPKFNYHLEISLNNDVYKVDTNDIHQALKEFVAPDIMKTKLIFRYNKADGPTKETVYFDPHDVRRFFHNQTALEILATTLVRNLG